MKKYLLRRVILSAMTMILMMIILFLLLNFMPGSPFNDAKLDPDQIAVLNRKYGLDKPVFERLLIYIKNVLQGDFGVSYVMSKNMPVSELISQRIGVSISIGFFSLVIGTIVGLVIGVFGALFQNRFPDHIAMVISMIGLAVPSYVFAVLFCFYLGFQWKLLPLLYDIRNPLLSSMLPVLASSIMILSVITKFTRDSVVSVMNSDYVLFARSQGIRTRTLIISYILRNSLLPIVTVLGGLVVSLLTGTLVLENIFAVPGIGSFMGLAIAYNDYNVILALSFVYSLINVVVMLFVDIVYGLLDPRIRVAGN